MSNNGFVWDKKWRETAKRLFSELLARGAKDMDIHSIPCNEQLMEEMVTLLTITRMEADEHTSYSLGFSGTVTSRIRLQPSSGVRSIFDAVWFGKYNLVDDDIYTAFSTDFGLTKAVDVELVHFNCEARDYEALAWGRRNGMRPIKAKHMFEIGIQHPREQCLGPILGLGSIRYGEAIYLDGQNDGDGINLFREIGLVDVRSESLPMRFRYGFIRK